MGAARSAVVKMPDLWLQPVSLAPHLRFETIDAERTLVLGATEGRLLRGRVQTALVQALDRPASGEVLARRLAGVVTPPEVLYGLQLLAGSGLVAVAPGPEAGLGGRCPPVALDGPLRQMLAEGLHRLEVPVDDGVPVRILGVEHPSRLPDRFPGVVIPVWGDGAGVWLGPVLGSRPDGPCLRCLRDTLAANSPAETWLTRRGRPPPATRPHPVALDLALSVLRRCLTGRQTRLLEEVLHFSLLDDAPTWHPLRRRPQCPACGRAALVAERQARPISLQPRPRAPAENGYRARSADDTWAALGHLVSRYTGVVSELGPVPSRDHPLRPVWGAAYPLVPIDSRLLGNPFLRVTSGKGPTPDQARLSALCEAIERRNAVWRGNENSVSSTIDDLEGAVAPPSLLHFSASQYASRAAHNASEPDWRRRIPRPFDPAEPLAWTPAWSLRDGARRWLPTRFCFAYVPDDSGDPVCFHDPNGQAAGSTIEDAVLQGLLELVERDAVSMWWGHRLLRPQVIPDPEDTRLQAVLDSYTELGWKLWLLDLTHDLGLPVVTAVGCHPGSGRCTIGFGAHVEARLAVWRAVTEAGQILDAQGLEDPPFTLPELARECGTTDFMHPGPARPQRDLPDHRFDRIDEAVRHIVDTLAERGLDTIVLDTSRPDVPLTTVRVAVPGLRHFWPRHERGRLFDVPVALGWVDPGVTEADLNPRPLFL